MITLSNNIGAASFSAGNPWAAVMPADFAEEPAAAKDQVELNRAPLSPTYVQSAPLDAAQTSGFGRAFAATGMESALAASPAPAALKLVLLGAASSAKEDLARQLSSQHKLPHLNMGDLIDDEIARGTDLGQALKESKSRGQDSPANLINQLLQERLDPNKADQGFILDAYPSDLAETNLRSLIASDDVKVVELTDKGKSCPTCIPAVSDADAAGCYYQVDDDGDRDSVGTVLDALVENFVSVRSDWLRG